MSFSIFDKLPYIVPGVSLIAPSVIFSAIHCSTIYPYISQYDTKVNGFRKINREVCFSKENELQKLKPTSGHNRLHKNKGMSDYSNIPLNLNNIDFTAFLINRSISLTDPQMPCHDEPHRAPSHVRCHGSHPGSPPWLS